jgi:transposase
VIIWHVLAKNSPYHDLGPNYFTRRLESTAVRERRLIRELEALGHTVVLDPTAA